MKSRICASFLLPACPFLPEVAAPLGPEVTRAQRAVRGPAYYLAALSYAQSLWRQAKPAQAILQLNKALMADLRSDESVLLRHPAPYAVLLWFLRHRRPDDFVGNPVRHFQHLATRVTGERRELRSWRAWACFHLSQAALPAAEFPPDREQIAQEGLILPEWPEVLARIAKLGWTGEVATLETAMKELREIS